MAITDRTRKLLWGASGNRCAMCRCPLVEPSAHDDDRDTVVGIECHIVSGAGNGPRAGLLSADLIDQIENLLLLCPNHHAVVDAQPAKYTVERLRQIKRDHEKWVRSELEPEKKLPRFDARFSGAPGKVTLQPILSGSQLLDLVGSVYAFHFDHPEPRDTEEAKEIADFLQHVQDMGDIYNDLGAGDRVREGAEVSAWIKALLERELLVYGGRYVQRLHVGDDHSPWPVAVVKISRPEEVARNQREAAAAS